MQHLAIILDGNRRWATEHKLETFVGHKRGFESIQNAIEICLKNDIKYLSLYVFSLENFRRSEAEKNYLFALLENQFRTQTEELIKRGVHVRFVGDERRFPAQIAQAINFIQEKTKDLDRLHMNLLFCYGSRQEIVEAAKKIAKKVKDGVLSVDEIDEKTINDLLWMGGVPDPDLIIRPGKVKRLSNFLLFQAAYSEFKFLDCYWPEVTQEMLQTCVDEFSGVKRNFGR